MTKVSLSVFDHELRTGLKAYDGIVGEWWWKRTHDKAHSKAYHNIYTYIAKNVLTKVDGPAALLDFACGSGTLLTKLAKQNHTLAFAGLDGSHQLLERASEELKKVTHAGHHNSRQAINATASVSIHTSNAPWPKLKEGTCTLVQTPLPVFGPWKGKFDIVNFDFPNITCSKSLLKVYDKHGYTHAKDSSVGELLARMREMDPEEEVDFNSPEDRYDDYMTARVISRNLRYFLKQGGLLVRVEYSNAPREELSPLNQWRSLFAEGALDRPINGRSSKPFFKLLNSKYYKSKVILDVHEQTGEKMDKNGGYFISLFEAI